LGAAAASAAVLSLALGAGTASAVDYPASGGLGAIADGQFDCGGAGANRDVTFNVSGFSGTFTNISATVTISHVTVGDVGAVLIPPSGLIPTVFHRPGHPVINVGHVSNLIGTYTFSDLAPANPTLDAAAASVGADEVVPNGSYRPSVPSGANNPWMPVLSSLPDVNGTWTLRFNDYCESGTGSVSAATLTIASPSDPDPPGGGGQPGGSTKKKCKKKGKGKAATAAKKKKKCKKRKKK
jgi:hypothetical protein